MLIPNGQTKGTALQDVFSFAAGDALDENGMTFSSHHDHHYYHYYYYYCRIPDHAFPLTPAAAPRSKPGELYRNCSYAENRYSSGPYPSSSSASSSPPPTSHPQPPAPPSRAPSSHSLIAPSAAPPKFSVWPSTRAISPIEPSVANHHRLSPVPISYSCATATTFSSCTVPSRGPSRSARRDLQYSPSTPAGKGQKRWNDDGGAEHDDDYDDVELPPTHPLYGLDTQQRRSYWDELPSYRSDASRLALTNSRSTAHKDSTLRGSTDSWSQVQFQLLGPAAQSYREILVADIERTFLQVLGPEARKLVRDMMSPMSESTIRSVGIIRGEEDLSAAVPVEADHEAKNKKTSGAGKLCQSLTCRTGATSPDGPARSVDPEMQSADVAAVPKKFGMAYLTRKMRSDPVGWRKYKDKQRKIHESTRGEVIAIDEEDKQHDAGAQKQNIELQPMQQSSQQELETPTPKSGVETSAGENHGDAAPPVQLSNTIQREPEGIISSSPTLSPSIPGPSHASPAPREPARERTATRIRATSQPPQSMQQRSESSRSSLSERLRTTRLEDLRLHSDTAQEIRELMLDLDRDRSQSMSKATGSRHRPALGELPGGFTSTNPTEASSRRSKSPRGALERHFQTLQEANDEARHRGQTPLRSQPSNLTLPRSFKAPTTHSRASLSHSRPSTSVTEDTNAEAVSAQSSSTAVDTMRPRTDGENYGSTSTISPEDADAEINTTPQRENS
ncbi:hypothetical protein ACJQWK_06361 [Exserohilum turcicum]